MVDQMVQYQCGEGIATQTITGIQIHVLGYVRRLLTYISCTNVYTIVYNKYISLHTTVYTYTVILHTTYIPVQHP